MSCQSVYYLLLLFPLIISECDVGGTWSTWRLSSNQNGYDICGSCWKANFIRQCLSEPYCPCNGPTEFVGEMNIDRCLYPRMNCCPGYKVAILNGIFACVNNTTGTVEKPPMNETPLPNDTYCPPSGVGIWGEWSNWSQTCEGACTSATKKRTRNCTSESYGCPCYKSDVGPCQTVPCPCYGQLNGLNLTTVLSYDGTLSYYYPFSATPPTGTWSEWTDVVPPACNFTCGMYGVGRSTRACFPAGSVCQGTVYSRNQSCPRYPVCFYYMDGLMSCKSPYSTKIIEGSTGCG